MGWDGRTVLEAADLSGDTLIVAVVIRPGSKRFLLKVSASGEVLEQKLISFKFYYGAVNAPKISEGKLFFFYGRQESGDDAVFEAHDLNTMQSIWFREGLIWHEPIYNYSGTFSDVIAIDTANNYHFINKQTGITSKLISRDSLYGFFGAALQSDSVVNVERISGSDSIQYYRVDQKDDNFSPTIQIAEYHVDCDCIASLKSVTRFGFTGWIPNNGPPLFYDINYQNPDSLPFFKASLLIFSYSGDTLKTYTFSGINPLQPDSTLRDPHFTFMTDKGGNFLLSYSTSRFSEILGRSTYQFGQHLLAFDSNLVVRNESEISLSQYVSLGVTSRFNQDGFKLNSDGSVLLGVRTFSSPDWTTAGLLKIDPNGISPLGTEGYIPKAPNPILEVYPNSFRVVLNVESSVPLRSIHLFNTEGQMVYEAAANNILSFSELLQAGIYTSYLAPYSLPEGVYYLVVQTDEGVITRKLLKTP